MMRERKRRAREKGDEKIKIGQRKVYIDKRRKRKGSYDEEKKQEREEVVVTVRSCSGEK